MNKEDLAKRLKNIRETLGITQEVAARAIDLPRTSLVQIEAGNRSVSTLELSKLARLYHVNISHFFESSANNEEPIEVLLYRAVGEPKQLKNQLYHYIELCKVGFSLENLLGYAQWKMPPQYTLTPPKNKSDATAQGENIAIQERKRLGLGFEPIRDISALIANQHIWAVGADLPENISGLFFNNTQTGLAILVNANHVKSRKRFSYAHEYAHVLLDRDGNNLRISEKDNHSELIELRANAFAAAFLMPEESISEFLKNLNKGQPTRKNQVIYDVATAGINTSEVRTQSYLQDIAYQDVAMIAHHFGVSYPSTVYRLRSLNFLTAQNSEKLIEKYPNGKTFLKTLHLLSDLEDKQSKNIDERDLINEIAYISIEAFRRHEISRGRIVEIGELLGIGGNHLHELALAALDDESLPRDNMD